MRTVISSSIKSSWKIHDSWTELLSGTRFLLDMLTSQNHDKIVKNNLLRLILVASFQMVEVMFFTQLIKCIDSESDHIKKLLQYDLKKRISFSEAQEKWTDVLIGKRFDYGSEPMQSMKRLSVLRNAAIHHTAECPLINIGESAYYTAIESSKYIYKQFNDGIWQGSEYEKFTKENQAKTKKFLCKALNDQ